MLKKIFKNLFVLHVFSDGTQHVLLNISKVEHYNRYAGNSRSIPVDDNLQEICACYRSKISLS